MKNKILTNTAVQIIGKIVNTIASILTTVIVARTLGVEVYGEFTKAFITATLFYVGIDFGLNAIVVRNMTENQKMKEEFQNALGLRIVLSLIFLLIVVVGIVILPTTKERGFSRSVKLATILFSTTFFSQSFFTTSNAIFQKILEYKKSVLAGILGSIATLLGVVVVIKTNPTIIAVVCAHVFGAFITYLVAAFLTKKTIGSISPQFNKINLLKLLKQASPIGLMLLANMVTNRLGVLSLSFFKSNAEVGIFGLAYRGFDVSLVIPTFLMNSTYPLMLEKYKQSYESFKSLLKQLIVFSLAAAFCVLLALQIISPYLGNIKAEFTTSGPILRILSLSLPVFFTSSLVQWSLVVMRLEKVLLKIYIVGMIFGSMLNFIFVPRYGATAAAILVGITESFILILAAMYLKKSLN